jgi:hypothetical protein
MERLFFLERGKRGNVIWTEEAIEWLRQNFDKYTNPQLAAAMGERVTNLRTKLYKLGLYKQRLEYWTEEQHGFLVENYLRMGDTEIAERMNELFEKKKGWSKKHVEKRRRQQGLKRTDEDRKRIFERNIKAGRYKDCNLKMWATRGVTADGEIRLWRNGANGTKGTYFIKDKGRFVPWNKAIWEKLHGPVPEGMVVGLKDFSRRDEMDPDNLELVTRQENVLRNSARHSQRLSDEWIKGIMKKWHGMTDEQIDAVPGIIEVKRNILKLKREIKNGKQGK